MKIQVSISVEDGLMWKVVMSSVIICNNGNDYHLFTTGKTQS